MTHSSHGRVLSKGKPLFPVVPLPFLARDMCHHLGRLCTNNICLVTSNKPLDPRQNVAPARPYSTHREGGSVTHASHPRRLSSPAFSSGKPSVPSAHS